MAMIWITVIFLGALVLGLLLAPALDVRLTRRVVNPILVAALLLVISLTLGNAASYADDRLIPPLGVLGGILAGLGIFFVVLGCARFALSDGEAQQAAPRPTRSRR